MYGESGLGPWCLGQREDAKVIEKISCSLQFYEETGAVLLPQKQTCLTSCLVGFMYVENCHPRGSLDQWVVF